MSSSVRSIAIALVAVVALSGAAAPALGSTAAQANAQQQASPGSCDYVSLYDETIGSVVSIQTDAGIGSGYVYETGGNGSAIVVTNAHVVGESDEVTVQFTRGESVTGTVVGSDTGTDLAAVRINESPEYAQALPTAASQPSHGTPVAALGNPFGLEGTITQGIVSGLNRSLPTRQGPPIPDTVQTDAAISSGNSGGPLVNCQGEVVGVNTAGIAAPGAENIGFAISSEIVQRVVPNLVESGEFDQPYLGIGVAQVTPAVAEANDLNRTTGVYVASVDEGGPSAGALQGAAELAVVDGQRVPVGGDVIVGVAGQEVRGIEDLSSILLTETEPGENVSITVVRDGQRTNVTVTAGERPDPDARRTGGLPAAPSQS
ncbi:S1C family serine protease [Halomicrobium urmianum]|uniref:S1C family serine protease n=1 Tax=Halomicrobium urmianum TaxID=1586233 RepID=UPI001CD95503|nr:trypsin-like peptidase domain-containing protein [Halomicrobium urmianum]